MKILILNPPSKETFERSGRWPSKSSGGGLQPPLFLAYTASILRENSFDVKLLDCIALNLTRNDIQIEIEKMLHNDDKLMVVIQTSIISIDGDLDFIKELKEKNPQIITILVGSHVTVCDAEIMKKNPQVDIIARGEYEYTIRDIALSIKKRESLRKIKGITFREDKHILRTPNRELIQNIDELPLPARDMLPSDKYFSPIFSKKPISYIISSRGCPFHCTFCSWPQTMYGHKLRLRNPIKIVDEIEEMKKQGIKEYYFDDDTFGVNKEHVIAICNEIIKRKIDMQFICMGRVDLVDEQILEKLAEAGCRIIKYGIESSSPEILYNIKKGITPEQIKRAFKITKDAGIKTYATVAFGLPGETKETIKNTISFIKKLNPDYVQFSIGMPYPGTEFFEQAKKEGWLVTTNWEEYNPIANSVIEYPNLKKEEIEKAVSRAYKSFYFRPSFVFKKLLKIKSASEFSHLLRGAKNLMKNI